MPKVPRELWDTNTLPPWGKRAGKHSSQREQHMQTRGQEKLYGILMKGHVVPCGWISESTGHRSRLGKIRVSQPQHYGHFIDYTFWLGVLSCEISGSLAASLASTYEMLMIHTHSHKKKRLQISSISCEAN